MSCRVCKKPTRNGYSNCYMCNYVLGTAPQVDGDKVMNTKLKSHAQHLINQIFYARGSADATDMSIQKEIDELKERMTEAESDMYMDGSVCCHEFCPHSTDDKWSYLKCKHCGEMERQPLQLKQIYPVTSPPPPTFLTALQDTASQVFQMLTTQNNRRYQPYKRGRRNRYDSGRYE